MADELDELIEFLADPRAEAKKMAAEIVEGLTGTQDGIDKLCTKSKVLIPALLRLFNEPVNVAKHAFTACVNLSQDPDQCMIMVERGAINLIMEMVKEGNDDNLLERGVMILSNVSLLEEGAEKLLQLGKGKMEGLHMARLMARFVEEPKGGAPDPFELVGSVLVNVTRHPEGRRVLVGPGVGLFDVLRSNINSRSDARRQGVAKTMKNLAFDTGTCLDAIMEDGAQLLEPMLRPIDGSDPKERDDEVRANIAEAIQLLVETRKGRAALWDVGAVEKLRQGYADEENPRVMEAMEAAARIFIVDGRGVGGGVEAGDDGENGVGIGEYIREEHELEGGVEGGEEGGVKTTVSYENGVRVVEREVPGSFFPGGIALPSRHFK